MADPRTLEYVRKSWHMATGLIATPAILYTSLPYASVVALGAAFFVVAIELLHVVFGLRVPFWTRQLQRVKRPNEAFSWASIGFLLTLLVLAWLLPMPIALAAAGMLTFGDGLSALVGRAIGSNPLPWNKRKTWEGTIAGFIGGLLGAWLLLAWYQFHTFADMAHYDPNQLVLMLIVGSACAMAAESLPRWQDNVTVPAGAGLSMFLVWAIFGESPALGALFNYLSTGTV